MKYLHILATCTLLILCGLVDWSLSHPTPVLKEDMADSLARNIRGDSGQKSVIADVNSGRNTDSSSKTLEGVDTEETQQISKPSKGLRSLTGDDVGTSQTGKVSESKTATQADKKKFLRKIGGFFLSWPVKMWKKIKQWFSKSFFKSNEKKPSNPSKDWFKIQTASPKKSTASNLVPTNETPDEVHMKQVGKEIPQEKPAPSKEEMVQQGGLSAQSLPSSSQLDVIKDTPDDSPDGSPKDQQSNDITWDGLLNIKDLHANSENLPPVTKGAEEPPKVHEEHELTQKTPEEQHLQPSVTLDPKEETTSKTHPDEGKSSVGIEKTKEEAQQEELKEVEKVTEPITAYSMNLSDEEYQRLREDGLINLSLSPEEFHQAYIDEAERLLAVKRKTSGPGNKPEQPEIHQAYIDEAERFLALKRKTSGPGYKLEQPEIVAAMIDSSHQMRSTENIKKFLDDGRFHSSIYLTDVDTHKELNSFIDDLRSQILTSQRPKRL